MNKSEDIKELAKALAKFQGEMEAITKDSQNPFFKSRYASLAAIIEDTREPLSKNGLSYAQFPDEQLGLTTILMHVSGQWLAATYTMTPVDTKPQSVGSAITYARRYALQSILGLQVEDDDGNEASKPKKRTEAATLRPRIVSEEELEEKPLALELTSAQMRIRIRDLLKLAGVDVTDKKACERYVADETQLALTPSNYKQIIQELEAK